MAVLGPGEILGEILTNSQAYNGEGEGCSDEDRHNVEEKIFKHCILVDSIFYLATGSIENSFVTVLVHYLLRQQKCDLILIVKPMIQLTYNPNS